VIRRVAVELACQHTSHAVFVKVWSDYFTTPASTGWQHQTGSSYLLSSLFLCTIVHQNSDELQWTADLDARRHLWFVPRCCNVAECPSHTAVLSRWLELPCWLLVLGRVWPNMSRPHPLLSGFGGRLKAFLFSRSFPCLSSQHL